MRFPRQLSVRPGYSLLLASQSCTNATVWLVDFQSASHSSQGRRGGDHASPVAWVIVRLSVCAHTQGAQTDESERERERRVWPPIPTRDCSPSRSLHCVKVPKFRIAWYVQTRVRVELWNDHGLRPSSAAIGVPEPNTVAEMPRAPLSAPQGGRREGRAGRALRAPFWGAS